MKYRELSIETSEAGIEVLTALFDAAGIENTEVSDPKDVEDIMQNKEKYAWDYIEEDVVKARNETPKMRLYFPDTEEGEKDRKKALSCIENLKKEAAAGVFGENADFGTLYVTDEIRDDGEWKDKWKKYFKPMAVSEHIVVCPSWESYEPKEGESVISIDPGMAFGTGTHETTSMCLELIDQYLKPGDRVLDAGTGSGILAIAASMLGAGEVLGVDIDREAVRVAKENAAKNHVKNVRIEYGDVTEGIPFEADLIAANLMAELLCMLAEGIRKHLAPGGIFISSGILTEKESMARDAYQKAGFSIAKVVRKGEWCAVMAVPSKSCEAVSACGK